jgi:hemolysin III
VFGRLRLLASGLNAFSRAVSTAFSIALCLVLDASGMLAHEAVVAALPKSTLLLVIIGGVFYSVGIIFHLWERLRFQNAIWLVAACCHYAAIMNCVILAA